MEQPMRGEVTIERGGESYTGWYTVDDDLLTIRVPDHPPVTTHLGNLAPEALARMLLIDLVARIRPEAE